MSKYKKLGRYFPHFTLHHAIASTILSFVVAETHHITFWGERWLGMTVFPRHVGVRVFNIELCEIIVI